MKSRAERGARQRLGKIDADLCFHPQRLTIRSRAGLESKAAKCFIEPLVVVAVPRPREIVRDHAPRGIDIEFGDHVRAAHFVRHRHRRNEHDGRGRWEIFLSTTSGSWSDARATAISCPTPYTTTRTGTTAVGSVAAATTTGARYSGDIRQLGGHGHFELRL